MLEFSLKERYDFVEKINFLTDVASQQSYKKNSRRIIFIKKGLKFVNIESPWSVNNGSD